MYLLVIYVPLGSWAGTRLQERLAPEKAGGGRRGPAPGSPHLERHSLPFHRNSRARRNIFAVLGLVKTPAEKGNCVLMAASTSRPLGTPHRSPLGGTSTPVFLKQLFIFHVNLCCLLDKPPPEHRPGWHREQWVKPLSHFHPRRALYTHLVPRGQSLTTARQGQPLVWCVLLERSVHEPRCTQGGVGFNRGVQVCPDG